MIIGLAGPRGVDPLIYVIFTVLFFLFVFTIDDPLGLFLLRLAHYGDRFSLPLAEEVLNADKRLPILYLRSFVEDKRGSRDEEALKAVLEQAGPFVAIGRPKQWLPPHGAARFYVPDDAWQDFVRQFFPKAALVVIVGGRTGGLGWELIQCRKQLEPNRLILVVPDDPKTYDFFRTLASTQAGLELPSWETIRKGRPYGRWRGFFCFKPNWEAVWISFPRRGFLSSLYAINGTQALAGQHLLSIMAASPYLHLRIPEPEPRRGWDLILLNQILNILVLFILLWMLFDKWH